jgi:hypothetical protein
MERKTLGHCATRESPRQQPVHPHGIPMFYGADRIDTAICEARGTTSSNFRVAEFRTTAGFHYVDLTAVPEDITEFHPELGELHFDLMFLRRFVIEVSKPASLGSPDLDYVPTQVVAEWFLRTSALHHPIMGIYYSSSIDQQGCWVVDVDNDHCVNAGSPLRIGELELELVESKILRQPEIITDEPGS